MVEDNSQQAWDERYREADQIWSGKVNAALADVAGRLDPGTALDLGSGEGADALWLAERGWQVTGVDISSVAVERAEQTARSHDLPAGQVRFFVADLTIWRPEQSYDLVVSSFLHSHGDFDRGAVMRSAKKYVAPGGHLLIISHATFPPWAQAHREDTTDTEHHHDATTPDSEIELMQLDPSSWGVELAETRAREANGPDGQRAMLDDTVVLLQKLDMK